MADLGGDHRLRAGRQRRIAHGERLVVGEVARLLLVGEGVAAEVQREHEVGLLDDLLAVEVEVRDSGAAADSVRAACPAKFQRSWSVNPSAWGWTAELGVVGDEHRPRGVPPGRELGVVDAELAGALRMSLGGVGRGAQVALRHQVGVDVVVGERAVLVGPVTPSMRKRPRES